MSEPAIWFVGDPHGEFRHVIRLAAERKPDAVIFLGDLELPGPLEEVFDPMYRQGIIVRGIHGNHDADREELWRRIADGPLAKSFNLDGRVEEICGLKIAGLGGIFRGIVWYPPDDPQFKSYADFDQRLVPSWWTDKQRAQKQAWAANQRLTHRATIFPDVYERLARQNADILITHEAPGRDGMHPHGFEAVDDLAELLGATKAFHGHHHEVRTYATGICLWTSVGFREIVDLLGNRVE
jgi:hypothetical protein